MPERIMRIACASSGQLALPSGGRAFLTEAEYSSLKSSGGREYSFGMPSGGSLLVLDLAEASESLGAKVPRGTDGPAPAIELPRGFEFAHMRSFLGSLPEGEFSAALRATHLVQWRRRTRFCPHCAAPLRESTTELALECPACSLMEFPRISPAVIVLIERKGRIALARNASFKEGMHSLIAGFVEAGESMEETAVREAREEIGIDIGNLRYFGSQDWPFPDSLMVGFRAEAFSSDLRPDGREILEAAWFGPDMLPPIPRKGSIARAMIDAWLAERGFKTEGR
jgi:NAD+ diphosphatase